MKETRISNMEKLIEQGSQLVANASVQQSTKDLWSTLVARESIRTDVRNFDQVATSADQAYANVFPGRTMSHAARTASAIILAAQGNEDEFLAKPARESSAKEWAGAMETAIPGAHALNADYGKTPLVATEYYTNKDLDKNLGLTWTLNVRALETQSAFAEKLFPTITVETNDVGITVRTKITTVTRGILNALLSKDSVLDDRKPLHNALTDHTVLQDDAIRIVPYVMETGENSEFFISENVIENETVRLGRVPSYPTNYLDIKKEKGNLFRLSAHPGIVAEGYDETDEIAPGAALGGLLISVRKPGDAVEDGSMIKLATRDMQFATFQRPPEGEGRELVLQFRRTQFALNGKSLDWKGKDIPALAALQQNKYTLRYVISISMSLFTNGQRSGQYDISGARLDVEALVDAAGNEVSMESGVGKTIRDNLKLELLGWKFDGTRTNENRRSQGLLLDPVWEQENYKLQYGSPMMTKQPVGQEYDDAERLDDLVSAVNIRNEMLAITQTLSYTDAVKQAVDTLVTQWDKSAIRGLGRHWVRPWFEEADFNVDEIVQSLETKDALINARQALLQRIADQVTRAIQDSRYMPALRLLTSNPQATPKVIIATDEPTAAMLLLQVGETRLLGDRYEYEVVTTNDDRWRIKNEADGSWTRRLQWVLKVEGTDEGSYCVLNWGNHFWSPIMVTNINIQRNGATSKELAVQPRNAHICHCPVTGLFWVKGITDLVAKKLAYNITGLANGQATTPGGNAGDVGGAAPAPAGQ